MTFESKTPSFFQFIYIIRLPCIPAVTMLKRITNLCTRQSYSNLISVKSHSFHHISAYRASFGFRNGLLSLTQCQNAMTRSRYFSDDSSIESTEQPQQQSNQSLSTSSSSADTSETNLSEFTNTELENIQKVAATIPQGKSLSNVSFLQFEIS